jgi:hypothetical protein
MNLRYKIIEIEKAKGLAGNIEILNDPGPIGEILLLKIKAIGGAEAFGVESDTFAWLLAGGYYLVIVREDDPDFNFDLQHALPPGAPARGIENRMTCRENILIEKFKARGIVPKPPGMGIPLGSMGGQLVKGKHSNDAPVFIPPPFPHLASVTEGLRKKLLDEWFRGIRAILSALKTRRGSISIVFEAGGDVVIPDWFLDWCQSNGIPILRF